MCLMPCIPSRLQMITSATNATGPFVAGRLVAGLGVGFESAIVILYMSKIVSSLPMMANWRWTYAYMLSSAPEKSAVPWLLDISFASPDTCKIARGLAANLTFGAFALGDNVNEEETLTYVYMACWQLLTAYSESCAWPAETEGKQAPGVSSKRGEVRRGKRMADGQGRTSLLDASDQTCCCSTDHIEQTHTRTTLWP